MKSTYLMLRNIAVVVGLCLPLSAAVTYSYDAADNGRQRPTTTAMFRSMR